MSDLRAYQEQAISAIDAALQENQRTLLVAACGTGKTRIFSTYVAQRKPKCALVLVHREELINQAREAIELATGRQVQIERAEARANLNNTPAVVASVPTLQRDARLQRFARDAFDLVIVDEAHHAVSGSGYQRILDWFSDAHVLGVTATPDRLDEKPLGEMFRSVAFEYEIDDAIRDGWLCPIVSKFIKIEELDQIRNVRTASQDFVQKDLDAVYTNELLNSIGTHIENRAGNRSTIAFTVSVRQAEYMAARSHVSAAVIHAGLGREDRANILDRFRSGSVRHLFNVGILTEGTDLPMTSCIAMSRPTMSRALYCQMMGRGLRLFAGKDNCLVLDFVGNSELHDTMCVVDAIGVNKSAKARQDAILEMMGHSGEFQFPVDLLQRAETAIRSANLAAAERLIPTKGPRKMTHGHSAMSILDLNVGPGRWGAAPISAAQTNALKRFGIEPGDIDRHQASALMGAVITRMRNKQASVAQLKVTKKLGLPIDVTRVQASVAIDLAKANKWKLTSDQIAQVLDVRAT